jgi:hypothetical protein
MSYTELRGPYRKATCELTWGLVLSLARNIPLEGGQYAQRRLPADGRVRPWPEKRLDSSASADKGVTWCRSRRRLACM